MNTKELIEIIINGNDQFVRNHNKEYFKDHFEKQNPYITLVTCSDSRVQPDVILPDSINKIFIIRNIGNQISSNEGSVDYGIYHLKTPVLLILGHSDCGAIKAFLKGYNHEPDTIKHELDNLKPVVLKEDKLIENIRKNINYQVDIAIKKYKELIQNGELAVVGAYYDFKNDLQKDHGRLTVININGENNN